VALHDATRLQRALRRRRRYFGADAVCGTRGTRVALHGLRAAAHRVA